MVMAAHKATFTAHERDILNHRLEAKDAVVECLTEDDDRWLQEELEEAVDSVAKRVETDSWDGMTDAEKAVLRNCVSNSLWYGSTEGKYERLPNEAALMARVAKSMRQVTAKVQAIVGGEKIEVVLW